MRRTGLRCFWAVLSVTVLVLSVPGLALARGLIVPELDGSIVAPALGMLAAGVMMLRARARK